MKAFFCSATFSFELFKYRCWTTIWKQLHRLQKHYWKSGRTTFVLLKHLQILLEICNVGAELQTFLTEDLSYIIIIRKSVFCREKIEKESQRSATIEGMFLPNIIQLKIVLEQRSGQKSRFHSGWNQISKTFFRYYHYQTFPEICSKLVVENFGYILRWGYIGAEQHTCFVTSCAFFKLQFLTVCLSYSTPCDTI